MEQVVEQLVEQFIEQIVEQNQGRVILRRLCLDKIQCNILQFYTFSSSFVIDTKIAGTSRILLKTLPNFFCGFIIPTHMDSQLRRKNFTHI